MTKPLSIFLLLLGAISTWMIWPLPARAASVGVEDNAHIFQQDAINRAEQIAQQIDQRYKRQVVVDTFSAIPDDKQSDFQAQGKDKFFMQWGESLAAERKLSGILVLICMKPGHVQIIEGNQTRRVFSDQDRDQLRDLLTSAFKSKQYDRGLVDAMRFIDDHMAPSHSSNASSSTRIPVAAGTANGGSSPPPVSSPRGSTGGFSIGGWMCAAIGILIILMLVVSLFNRRRGYSGYGGVPGGYPQGGYPQGGYPPAGNPQSGGGFGRGLMGGLLGGVLGSWGYDRMTRGGGGGVMGGPPMGGGGRGGGTPDLPPDTSYSGSGGDFDSSGPSGGDMGSSGGDFGGGGDVGGGGDSGSSGGDF